MTVLSQAKAVLAAAIAGVCISSVAQAADAYPNKPIRLIVPFAAGGTTDIVARIVAEGLTRELGQAVVVENRGGGGGSIGADALARSTPDGYTLGVATVSTMATNPATNPKNPYNPLKDFVPITNMVNVPNVLTVNPSVPAKNLAEFIALLKANPGKVNYGSAGIGSAPQLGGELLNYMAGVRAMHVPYRGSAPAMADVIGGHLEFMIDSAPTGLAQVQAGTVRLLATSMAQRLPQTPDTPPIADAVPGYEAYTWNAVFAPAGTPAPVVEKLNATLRAALADPDLKRRAYDMGLVLQPDTTPAELSAFLQSELKKWSEVARAANMSAN